MEIFIGLSITIVIAAVIAGILQRLKQPVIIGHIVTGLIVGPYFLHNAQFSEVVDTLSQVGIALLLFIIGLSLTPKVIKDVGKASFFTGLSQIFIVSTAGFGVAKFLGFSNIIAVYLGLALTFSSTIIIMKLLSDKKDLGKYYTKISIGLLLFQDLIVALMLIGISAISNGGANLMSISLVVLKGIIVFDLVILFTIYVIPLLSSSFARSQEFLFLFSIAWGLGLATLFHFLGFSMEIGALVAGVALSTSPYHFEISSRLRPLRDFFVILFFVLLGSKIQVSAIHSIIYPAVVLSLFVLIVKPILVMFLTASFRYRRKVNFLTGLNFSQISEFSLVLVILAVKMGQLPGDIVTLVTLVSLITITVSSYLVLYGDKIYPYLSRFVPERRFTKNGTVHLDTFDVILFGCNRIGLDFVSDFKDLGHKFLVVDFNPESIEKLTATGVNCRYGDAEDNEFLDELNLASVKMVISTIPDFEANNFLISKVTSENKNAVIMAISHEIDEAINLYEAGATYVLTPHFLGGKYASMLISKYGFDVEKFVSEKEKHLKDLRKRKEVGHPQIISER